MSKTEQRTYTVLYEKGPTGWGAYVPDFDGCIAIPELTTIQPYLR
ncbi:MAG TPA: hypothetical protein VFB38_13390 [Chthonomonadaceae bacterium]|nr:hypothetical protein [Chthonomonadaceae bacterium]